MAVVMLRRPQQLPGSGAPQGLILVTAFCRIALRGWRFAGASFLGLLFFLRRDEDNFKNDDSFQDHGVCSPPNKMSIKCGSENRTNAKTDLASS